MHLPFVINNRGKLVERPTNFALRLAQSMVRPIRRSLDYQGIARRALVVEQLPQGALPDYNKVFGNRVTVPEFEIYQNPTIKISDVKRRRFNIIVRHRKKLFINNRG